MNNLINIFVYGTLRPPQPETQPNDSRFYPEIAPYGVSATPARVEGAELYDHGEYPYWASPALIEDCPRIASGNWFARQQRKETNITYG